MTKDCDNSWGVFTTDNCSSDAIFCCLFVWEQVGSSKLRLCGECVYKLRNELKECEKLKIVATINDDSK